MAIILVSFLVASVVAVIVAGAAAFIANMCRP
jgi:hypothetical protein